MVANKRNQRKKEYGQWLSFGLMTVWARASEI